MSLTNKALDLLAVTALVIVGLFMVAVSIPAIEKMIKDAVASGAQSAGKGITEGSAAVVSGALKGIGQGIWNSVVQPTGDFIGGAIGLPDGHPGDTDDSDEPGTVYSAENGNLAPATPETIDGVKKAVAAFDADSQAISADPYDYVANSFWGQLFGKQDTSGVTSGTSATN